MALKQFEPESDLPELAKIAVEAWPPTSLAIPLGFLQDYIELYRAGSSWNRVATVSNKPVGLVLGRIDRDFGLADRIRVAVAFLRIVAWTALGLFGPIPHRFRFLAKLLTTETKARRSLPPADAELTLLFLAPDRQGRGIGRSMVEEFMQAARKKGCARLVLCTSEDSNWRFYEQLGFTRYSQFYDYFDSYLMEKRILGFAYMINLD